ncbi:MAG: DUF554 domain-containing protein [Clostridiales bacterium]|nr:DUF554 domain-containing protein [Clostridiales bacterium]
MIGTLINVAAVIVGSFIGLLMRKGIPQRMQDTLMQGMGLCVMLIGIQGALKTENVMLVILAIVIGGVIGVLLQIEKRLDRLGERLQKHFSRAGDDHFGKGFVTASLMYCVGAMAIVGSLDSGLRGDHSTLIAKSILDGVNSIILASAMGPGVMLSALAVLIYQGSIALLAQVVEPLLTARAVTEMSAVGGLLIVGIGLNMIRKEHIPVGDMLPAILTPLFLIYIL